MEELIKTITCSIAGVIEGLSALLIAHAIIKAALSYARVSPDRKNRIDQLTIRLELGKSLALSLEFLLAADILRTAVAPTWEDIGKLAAIAALRTLLNYFLDRELKHGRARDVVPNKNGVPVQPDSMFI